MVIIQRLLSMALVVWLAATLAFFALRILPGDAVEAQLARSGVSETVIQQRRTELGIDQPLLLQYLSFLANLLRGNLGSSLIDGLPVTELITQRLGATVALASGALCTAVLGGIILGISGSMHFRRGISTAARFIISFSISTPIYWTGTLAIFIAVVLLRSESLSTWLLPVMILGFHTSGPIARVVQVNIRNTLDAEFVRTARAKGLPEHQVLCRHILRVALLPVIGVIALQTGFLLGGTVITESLFVRAGIGRLLLDRTLLQDYPVVQGIIVLSAVVYAVVNAAADLLTRVLDPRIAS